jgi:hypothetical protein
MCLSNFQAYFCFVNQKHTRWSEAVERRPLRNRDEPRRIVAKDAAKSIYAQTEEQPAAIVVASHR